LCLSIIFFPLPRLPLYYINVLKIIQLPYPNRYISTIWIYPSRVYIKAAVVWYYPSYFYNIYNYFIYSILSRKIMISLDIEINKLFFISFFFFFCFGYIWHLETVVLKYFSRVRDTAHIASTVTVNLTIAQCLVGHCQAHGCIFIFDVIIWLITKTRKSIQKSG
jgi:hypothetical protein